LGDLLALKQIMVNFFHSVLDDDTHPGEGFRLDHLVKLPMTYKTEYQQWNKSQDHE
jgi:hypothetical protein